MTFHRNTAAAFLTLFLTAMNPLTTAIAKDSGVFFTPDVVRTVRANCETYGWAGEIRVSIVESAAPYLEFSDDELWHMMFGNTITRARHVWSDGYCPSCRRDVPLYSWKGDPLKYPWKLICPHCGELFPKNDFKAFYDSGLDEHNIFDPARADRSLLYNTEHPDHDDPLHMYGVDDGNGYVANGRRWRFVGFYLGYAHWAELVMRGIDVLSDAYVLTGDPVYAHKALVLLDRTADLWPTFDFKEQGIQFEGRVGNESGYIQFWYPSNTDISRLALSYDQVFDTIAGDMALQGFLAEKAGRYGLDNPKRSAADIQRNIEDRILRDALANPHKISSNFPKTEFAISNIRAVLDWPHNRDELMKYWDGILTKATMADGVTGEKGLASYGIIIINDLPQFFGKFNTIEPDFMSTLLERYPRLYETYRFHIDTRCLDAYYPNIGDSGDFGKKLDVYPTMFKQGYGIAPSMHSFFWQLYRATGDTDFIKVMYRANGMSSEGIPWDLYASDVDRIQGTIDDIIEREGTDIHVGSVNKEEWHVAILRSGEGDDARAVWLNYALGWSHAHYDVLNLGIFGKGLDLMGDFGYPSVHYGGWYSPKAVWYRMTCAHNSVTVDGVSQRFVPHEVPPTPYTGVTTLWADGDAFHAVRASAPDLLNDRDAPVKQYERTVGMIDVSGRDFYVVDVFRVLAGTTHYNFMHTVFADLATDGLDLSPADPYGYETEQTMRNFMADTSPDRDWYADWRIEDYFGYLDGDRDIHVRYRGLTDGIEVQTMEGWINAGNHYEENERWFPRIMMKRSAGTAPLASTFAGIIEPYEDSPFIAGTERLTFTTPDGEAYPLSNVAVAVTLADGRMDIVAVPDTENPSGASPALTAGSPYIVNGGALTSDAELAFVRLTPGGAVERMAMTNGSRLSAGGVELDLTDGAGYIELTFANGTAEVVSGSPGAVRSLKMDGRTIDVK